MGLLKETFINFFNKNRTYSDDKEKYIFFKIVDSYFLENVEHYTIQCVNKKSLFHAKISEIVFDTTILYGFHPTQACYIGMEYAKQFKEHNNSPEKNIVNVKNNSASRYGSYILLFQDRKGNVCFSRKKTHEQFIMDPRDIALSKELIIEFDSAEAFYIGLLAGFKLNNPIKNSVISNHNLKKPLLRIVK